MQPKQAFIIALLLSMPLSANAGVRGSRVSARPPTNPVAKFVHNATQKVSNVFKERRLKREYSATTRFEDAHAGPRIIASKGRLTYLLDGKTHQVLSEGYGLIGPPKNGRLRARLPEGGLLLLGMDGKPLTPAYKGIQDHDSFFVVHMFAYQGGGAAIFSPDGKRQSKRYVDIWETMGRLVAFNDADFLLVPADETSSETVQGMVLGPNGEVVETIPFKSRSSVLRLGPSAQEAKNLLEIWLASIDRHPPEITIKEITPHTEHATVRFDSSEYSGAMTFRLRPYGWYMEPVEALEEVRAPLRKGPYGSRARRR